MKGIYIRGYVTSDCHVKDIDIDEFNDFFIKWIEDNNMQFCGLINVYDYEDE